MEQYVVALDFGYPSDPKQRSTIDDLADFIVRNYADEPKTVVLAQEFIYAALLRRGFPRERLLEVGTGQSNTNGLESGGSYHMLREATGMMRELAKDDFGTRPLTDDLGPGRVWPPIAATVVAHALHVRRVVRQGRLFGLQLAPPPQKLPTALYRNAAQWWCRGRLRWYLREIIGFIPLRLAGQI